MQSKVKYLISSLLICLCIQNVMSVKLQKGELFITISEQHKQDVNYKVNINSKIKSVLELTQSSRVKIQGKLQFTNSQFKPEYFSFRLKHNTYQNLTQPVLVKYDSQDQSYFVTLDLGDPKQIKPYSANYQLQVILGDDQLEKNVRNIVADCNVKFRKSWDSVPSSDLHYKTQNIIETSAPVQRVDPPKMFTLFVVLLILALNAVFIYGLNHLKVNVSLFPKSSNGFLINIGLLVILMANLAILLKFWINWTFLQTLKYLLILLLPTALVGNYALVHVQKH